MPLGALSAPSADHLEVVLPRDRALEKAVLPGLATTGLPRAPCLIGLTFSLLTTYFAGEEGPPGPKPEPSQKQEDIASIRKHLIKQYDRNGNGKIDAQEHRDYIRAISREQREAWRAQTRKVFAEHSTSSNGKIDPPNEFLRKKYGTNSAATSPAEAPSVRPQEIVPW